MTGPALDRLERAWQRTDRLFALVRPGALLRQPIRLRQPILFYVGHLPAFAWNHLGRGVLGLEPFDADLDALFERGIDPEDEHDPTGTAWPPEPRVIAYRDRIRAELRERWEAVLMSPGRDGRGAGAERAWMVIEHELMHHETLLYMLQELPSDELDASGLPGPATGPGRTPRWVDVPGGSVRLGADAAEIPFGWDNEHPARLVDVESFRIEDLPVRVRDFAAFVDDGGYRRADLWSPRGWPWRERAGLERPRGWMAGTNGILWTGRLRTLSGPIPLSEAADWPVSVSWAEADAFARWAGGRLPTEAELRRASHGAPGGDRAFPWGDEAPDGHANLGFVRWSPEPVGSRPAGVSAWGVHETLGNGWEWTSSLFEPLPGFQPRPSYPGYSADFFDGKHYVLLGASWATDAQLARRSFRNWFQPHYPYPFSKFRLVAR